MLDNGYAGNDLRWVAAALTVFAGLSMVSNLRFYSFKDFNPRKSVPFIMIFLLAMFFVVISSYPAGVLFMLFLAYSLSGYALWLLALRKPKHKLPPHL
jgi:CDP-diacylglycerol--serine O-phosphatidyltransferase